MRQTLLTVKEVSSYLRVHPKTIYRMARAGTIPHVRLNGGLRFERAGIEEMMGRRRVHSPFEFFSNMLISLDEFDKRFLKGGRSAVRKGSRRWNYNFGSIFLRKTKKGKIRWCVDYRNREGQRIREVVKEAQTRGEASIALQQKVAEVFNGKFHPFRKNDSMKFSRLAETYLEDYAKVKKRSWKTDKGYIEKSMKPFFKDASITQITPLDVEKYIKRRLEDGVSKTTVNRCLQILKRMFNLAIDWGYASENPVRKVRLFSEKDNLKERVLSAEEEVRLLDASPEHLKPIIIMALNTGMRRGEILGLRWLNVDFERRIIKIEKSKSGEQRSIEINGTLLELFRRLRTANPGSEFVFSTFKTRQPFVEVGKAFRRASKIAGISGVRFHDLRHTFASRLIEAGVDIITVKELLGHSSVKITERYTHTRSELKRRAVEKLQQKSPEFLAQIWHKNQKADQKLPLNLYFSMN
jgi:excisionase family DNA binding protein